MTREPSDIEQPEPSDIEAEWPVMGVRLPESDRAAVARVARMNGWSDAYLVRRAIRTFLSSRYSISSEYAGEVPRARNRSTP